VKHTVPPVNSVDTREQWGISGSHAGKKGIGVPFQEGKVSDGWKNFSQATGPRKEKSASALSGFPVWGAGNKHRFLAGLSGKHFRDFYYLLSGSRCVGTSTRTDG